MDIWTQFATTGNPNTVYLKDQQWQPLKKSNYPYVCLNIADTLNLINLPETKRMELWDSLYE